MFPAATGAVPLEELANPDVDDALGDLAELVMRQSSRSPARLEAD
jgi:hypothetical protein